MTQVMNIAPGWHCSTCGRDWSPTRLACPICAKAFTQDERVQFLERYGYRKRIDKMNAALAKVGL